MGAVGKVDESYWQLPKSLTSNHGYCSGSSGNSAATLATGRSVVTQGVPVCRARLHRQSQDTRGQNRTLRPLSTFWPLVFPGEQDVGQELGPDRQPGVFLLSDRFAEMGGIQVNDDGGEEVEPGHVIVLALARQAGPGRALQTVRIGMRHFSVSSSPRQTRCCPRGDRPADGAGRHPDPCPPATPWSYPNSTASPGPIRIPAPSPTSFKNAA